MNIIKKILQPFRWLKKQFARLKRRWVLAKAYPKLKEAYELQLVEQKKLKKDIMAWLREYFRIDAKSKYIPKDYKNNEEVKVAVLEKFGNDLIRLNLKYTDIFA